MAADHERTPFFRASVRARPAPLVCFAAFVAAGLPRPVLTLFGVIDLLGAIWTGAALRSDREMV